MELKPKYLVIVTGLLLVVLIVYLQINIVERQEKINKLMHELQQKTYATDQQLRLKNNELLEGIKSPTLIILFTNEGCAPCISKEIESIKRYHKYLAKNLRIYFIGNEDELQFEFYRRNFKIKAIDISKAILDGFLTIDNPVALLVDSRGNIYDVHKAKYREPKLSDAFYKKMGLFFKEINSDN